jgi:hypothetical protein
MMIRQSAKSYILLSFMFLFYHSERQVAQARLATSGAGCHQEEVLLEVVQLGRGELGERYRRVGSGIRLVPIGGRRGLQVLHVGVDQLLDSSDHVTHLLLEVVRIGLIGVNNTAARPGSVRAGLREEGPRDVEDGGILAEVDDELGHLLSFMFLFYHRQLAVARVQPEP